MTRHRWTGLVSAILLGLSLVSFGVWVGWKFVGPKPDGATWILWARSHSSDEWEPQEGFLSKRECDSSLQENYSRNHFAFFYYCLPDTITNPGRERLRAAR